MKLSVVILNYNVRYFLEQCIVSVQRALKNIDSEILVIDNASKDDSCEMVRSRFPEVKLIENNENLGFSKANNMAVAEAKGAYVCILNPDTAVSEDTFVKLLAQIDDIENHGAVGVQLIDGTGNFLPESKRNVPTPRISFSKLFGIGKNRATYYAEDVAHDKKGEVDVLVGAFMLIKREVYNEVSGFDEDYFMYGEDIDLSYKIKKAGYANWYVGDIKVLHYKGESTLRDKQYANRFYGAMQIFYKKHFSRNLASNALVSLGIGFARMLRKSRRSQRQHYATSKPPKAVVLTENLTLLQQLSATLDTPVQTMSKAKLFEGFLSNTCIIFDVDYLPYAHVFEAMEALKGGNNTFRIKPPGCNFILGSDCSDQKGSVIVF